MKPCVSDSQILRTFFGQGAEFPAAANSQYAIPAILPLTRFVQGDNMSTSASIPRGPLPGERFPVVTIQLGSRSYVMDRRRSAARTLSRPRKAERASGGLTAMGYPMNTTTGWLVRRA